MRIPSQHQCFELIRKMEMLSHIVDHSVQVCRVALFLTENLNRESEKPYLNENLVMASALLHDITKTRSFDTKEDHAETGGQLLKELDYPEVGDIIAQHVCLWQYDKNGDISEAAIVNYSDKRVLHDRIVSFQERMDYIFRQYGEYRKKLEWLLEKTLQEEKKIFSNLPFGPDDLVNRIDSVEFSFEKFRSSKHIAVKRQH